MNKKRLLIIVSIVVGALVIAGLYGTMATEETASTEENVYNITLTGNSNEVVVPAGSSKTVLYQVTNTNKGLVNYGLTFAGENIEVKVYDDSIDKETDLIDYGETKFVKLLITNTGTTDSTATVNVVLGYENDTNLNVPNLVLSGHSFVTETYTNPSGGSGSGGSGSSSSGTTLIEHITNLYTNAEKTEVTNNSITYNYATSVSLMNDRLGDSTVDADSGNIRYYGSNPNNYIYFNCSDYSSQSSETCEIWRIIGIVDGKVKLIRNESIGNYAWNTNIASNWSTSTLNAYLNGDYYSSLNTKNSKTIGLISQSTYYLGGYNSSDIYSNEIYKYERTDEEGTTIYSGNPFTEETNIGIMYASDYGYATDFNACSMYLYEYVTECYSNDWLSNSDYQWLITPFSDCSECAWGVDSSGHVFNYDGLDYLVGNEFGVRPVLYLDSELSVESGTDGSSTDPYKLVVSTDTDDSGSTPDFDGPGDEGDFE